MKPFLILLAFVAIAALGLSAGYFLQQRQHVAERPADQALQVPDKEVQEDATSQSLDGEFDEDDDEADYRDLMAQRALTDNCLVCHEDRMFTSQRLTAAQWKAEIDKMIGWGAVLPEIDRGPVEEYLIHHYGEDSPAASSSRIALADVATLERPGDPTEGTTDADTAQGAQLYKIICASCHGPSALGTDLGPALVDRAVLTHAGAYHETIDKGRRKMPAMNAMLKPEQSRDILAWLRGLDAAKELVKP